MTCQEGLEYKGWTKSSCLSSLYFSFFKKIFQLKIICCMFSIFLTIKFNQHENVFHSYRFNNNFPGIQLLQ